MSAKTTITLYTKSKTHSYFNKWVSKQILTIASSHLSN
ncbi:hypothetical protein [Caudoviricetes sp.]|nr:hypothetical protein [Caudoviricetes sp.]